MPGSKVAIWGMVLPHSIGNPYIGYTNPTIGYINPTIGLMTIPYYMETMGV